MMKGRVDQGEKEKGRKANGIAGYLEALNAKRSLLNAGLSLALTWRDLSSALKKFSKAMGGVCISEPDRLFGVKMSGFDRWAGGVTEF